MLIPLPAATRRIGSLAVLLALCTGISGCTYFRAKQSNRYVYVTAKQTVLRDRVAAVSMRTGTAYNGEKLEVLDRARRFLQVRTPRGEVGWIEEKLTANQHTADQFDALRAAHSGDSVVAAAVVRDEVYMHVAPGRETPHFYRLAEGDTLSLLERATVPKPLSPEAAFFPHPAAPADTPAGPHTTSPAPPSPPAPVLEDWWLARNGKGQTGWLLSRMVDVTAPDALARYAEGQRIVGAYVLAHVQDPDSGIIDHSAAVTDISEYVTVLAPYQAGLPYDFNQVRVFVWNLRKHRYETGFRENNIAGYLPVDVGPTKDPYGAAPMDHVPLPGFTYRVLAANSPIPAPDPATGLFHPAHLITKTYRLEGNICRRVLPPGAPIPAQALPPSDAPKNKGKNKKKRGKG